MFTLTGLNVKEKNVQVAAYVILQQAQQEEGPNHVWEWASVFAFVKYCSEKWR